MGSTAAMDGSGDETNILPYQPALPTCLFVSHDVSPKAAQQRRNENALHKRSRNYFTNSGS